MTADPFRISLGNLREGIVVDRPNRFVAVVTVDGREVPCHLADSGRLKELIYPGNRVMVRPVADRREKPGRGGLSRKTAFDLVLASAGGERAGDRLETSGEGKSRNRPEKSEHDGTTWVSVDTRYPTRLFGQVLRARGIPEFAEYDVVRAEHSFQIQESRDERGAANEHGSGDETRQAPSRERGDERVATVSRDGDPAGKGLRTRGSPDAGPAERTGVRKEPRSRLDFYLEGPGVPPALVEVKSVTLCVNGRGLFPDAPTVRGARHLRELAGAVSAGYRAYAVFIAQREDILTVSPNRDTDPMFAEALTEAANRGVRLLAYRCRVSPRESVFDPALLPVVV